MGNLFAASRCSSSERYTVRRFQPLTSPLARPITTFSTMTFPPGNILNFLSSNIGVSHYTLPDWL